MHLLDQTNNLSSKSFFGEFVMSKVSKMLTDRQIVRLGGCDGCGDSEPCVPSLHPEGGQGQPGEHQS